MLHLERPQALGGQGQALVAQAQAHALGADQGLGAQQQAAGPHHLGLHLRRQPALRQVQGRGQSHEAEVRRTRLHSRRVRGRYPPCSQPRRAGLGARGFQQGGQSVGLALQGRGVGVAQRQGGQGRGQGHDGHDDEQLDQGEAARFGLRAFPAAGSATRAGAARGCCDSGGGCAAACVGPRPPVVPIARSRCRHRGPHHRLARRHRS